MFPKPLIGVTACRQMLGSHSSHTVGHKYLEAASHAGAALVIPALPASADLDTLLEKLDGILFTGSPSNIEPHHYGESSKNLEQKHDPDRDALTLALIKKTLEKGIPIFCICRGFQELNVALGGTLHQLVHEVEGFADHREPVNRSVAETYELSHSVSITSGGQLEKWGFPAQFEVNSLHGQGINRLAAPLRVEAFSPDGLVEAVSAIGTEGFAFGAQWHPEWKFKENPISLLLFNKFKAACEKYARHRNNLALIQASL
ncbi:gamma-glutamyl-gamma-aminobutyrate hydrolase family protein [Pseudomonas sp. Pf153]|uniref:gamma-glutamyl-gamma-aminobutyrate hydrolase family protein n=1 Tax=Pseudomonas sp. Pf153 TaxID=1699309 RepID=UPI0009EB564C|nr:gamma-glutamyl-gamma-aminobutyrate hydrolase family protein [Pseudomonas sp. Pf153]